MAQHNHPNLGLIPRIHQYVGEEVHRRCALFKPVTHAICVSHASYDNIDAKALNAQDFVVLTLEDWLAQHQSTSNSVLYTERVVTPLFTQLDQLADLCSITKKNLTSGGWWLGCMFTKESFRPLIQYAHSEISSMAIDIQVLIDQLAHVGCTQPIIDCHRLQLYYPSYLAAMADIDRLKGVSSSGEYRNHTHQTNASSAVMIPIELAFCAAHFDALVPKRGLKRLEIPIVQG